MEIHIFKNVTKKVARIVESILILFVLYAFCAILRFQISQ